MKLHFWHLPSRTKQHHVLTLSKRWHHDWWLLRQCHRKRLDLRKLWNQWQILLSHCEHHPCKQKQNECVECTHAWTFKLFSLILFQFRVRCIRLMCRSTKNWCCWWWSCCHNGGVNSVVTTALFCPAGSQCPRDSQSPCLAEQTVNRPTLHWTKKKQADGKAIFFGLSVAHLFCQQDNCLSDVTQNNVANRKLQICMAKWLLQWPCFKLFCVIHCLAVVTLSFHACPVLSGLWCSCTLFRSVLMLMKDLHLSIFLFGNACLQWQHSWTC